MRAEGQSERIGRECVWCLADIEIDGAKTEMCDFLKKKKNKKNKK